MSKQFIYRAMDKQGIIVQGQLDAHHGNDLQVRLERMNLDLIYFREKRITRWGNSKISRLEIINFCFYMEQLTRAGVPIIEGLEDLRDSLPQSQFRDIVSNLIENIQGGEVLSEAMRHFPDTFDTVFTSLIAAGEESGNLNLVFAHLTNTLKWQDEMIAKMKKLLMYPAFVGIVVLGVLTFLLTYLVPQLTVFIKNIGGELPFYTILLLTLSDIFIYYWYLIFGLPTIFFIIYIFILRNSTNLRFWHDGMKLKIWVIGPILEKMILARFANFFALMYRSGITVLDALRISKALVGNAVIQEGLQTVSDYIEEGFSIGESFEKAELFPPLVLRMVRVGETTGELDIALTNVGYFYDREVKESLDKLQVMIEPTITVILGLLLGWIMASVLLPVYDSISKFAGV